MPNIRTYENQVRTPRASAARSSAAAASGAVLGQAFESLGQSVNKIGNIIDQRQGAQETSALTNDYAKGFAELTKNWNETAAKADPNDPELAQQWRNTVLEPYLEKFGEDIGSTAGTALKGDLQNRLRMHFFDKTVGDQAILAGAAVKTNLETAINNFSTTAYADPSSFKAAIDGIDFAIEAQIASHPNLTPADAAQIRSEIGVTAKANVAKAALQGMSDINPEEAQKAIAAGKFSDYLHGPELAAQNTYAINQQKAKEADARRAKDDAIREQAIASDKRRNEVMSTFSVNGQVKIPKGAISQILADPTMQPADKDALIGIVKRLTEVPEGAATPKTDYGLYNSLFDRIMLPTGDPRKINDENVLNQFVNRGLTFDAYNQLKGLIQGSRTTEGALENDLKRNFTATAKSLITGANPLLGIRDPKGDENYQRFLSQFLPAYDKAVKAGANPVELLSPDGPFFKSIQQYRRSPQQQMQDLINSGSDMKKLLEQP